MAFPEQRDRELIRQAEELVERATDLNEWLADFSPTRQDDDLGMIPDRSAYESIGLRRSAMSLYSSARVPAAAAVYGPSQVGKSLFVGSVLRPVDDKYSPLGRDDQLGEPAYFQQLSFTNDLNPQSGSNEATALVTRFTTKDRMAAQVPSRFPVMVRALTRSQWLRVLARGFRAECEQDETVFDDTALEKIVAQCECGDESTPRTWRIDLLDTWDYARRHEPLRYQAGEPLLNGLLSRYSLTEEGCVQLAAALFWRRWPGLTRLFRNVAALIERIQSGGREGIVVHWGCVRFLLDSQRSASHENPQSRVFESVAWKDVTLSEQDGWLTLDYSPGRSGDSPDLAMIQAAMLELVVPVLPHRLSDDWKKVAEQFDLLDIPGMRAGREGAVGGLRQSAESEAEQLEIVKRGKVHYLFDRYIDERQVQTLLLLNRGGNLEVRGQMKGHVDAWGRARYGKDWPEQITDDPPALFVGLTGIDEEFRNRSSYAGSELYDNRLRQLADTLDNFLDNFGSKGRDFRNVYPLRFPGTWDADRRQQEQEDAEKWKRAGSSFTASEWVQRYVADPEERWATAMVDRDGGLSLISRGFRSTTDSRRKQDELQQQISVVRSKLTVLGESWRVPADANLERQKRIDHASTVLEWLTSSPEQLPVRCSAMNEALCLADGDTVPIADFASLRWNTAQMSAGSIEHRLKAYVDDFLGEWATSLAPDRWQKLTSRRDFGAPWLSLEDFHHTAVYLADFLRSAPVFDALCDKLQIVIQVRLRDESASRQSRRKYSRMILNDFITQPGFPVTTPPQNASGTESKTQSQQGSLQPLIDRWKQRWPESFGQGAGDEVRIPAGNNELAELMEGWN